MKHFFVSLLICSIFAPFRAFSCGNEYETYIYTRPDGSTKRSHDYFSSYYFEHGFDKEELEANRKRLEKKLAKSNYYKTMSDYALVLLKLGEHKKSLEILQKLERKYPNEYTIIANLGTAYELNGQIDSALKYIQRAVRINPMSHEGSEWIHVKILKAKIKDRNPSSILQNQTILGLDISVNKNYSEEEKKKFSKIKRELIWQLTERIKFVGAPDATVAILLGELADLIAVTEYLENSVPVYELSLKYAPNKLERVNEHRDKVKKIIFWGAVRRYFVIGVSVFAGFSLLAYILIKLWKRRRKRKVMLSNSIKQ